MITQQYTYYIPILRENRASWRLQCHSVYTSHPFIWASRVPAQFLFLVGEGERAPGESCSQTQEVPSKSRMYITMPPQISYYYPPKKKLVHRRGKGDGLVRGWVGGRVQSWLSPDSFQKVPAHQRCRESWDHSAPKINHRRSITCHQQCSDPSPGAWTTLTGWQTAVWIPVLAKQENLENWLLHNLRPSFQSNSFQRMSKKWSGCQNWRWGDTSRWKLSFNRQPLTWWAGSTVKHSDWNSCLAIDAKELWNQLLALSCVSNTLMGTSTCPCKSDLAAWFSCVGMVGLELWESH